MRTFAVCIIVFICGTVLLGIGAVVVPALTYTPPEPRIPNEGNARALYAEHAETLNAAADILWAHPEFFEQVRWPGEYSVSIQGYEILEDQVDHSTLTDAEWQQVVTAVQESFITEIEYLYYEVPWVWLFAGTTEDGLISLGYCRTENFTDSQMERSFQFLVQGNDRVEMLDAPNWYVDYLVWYNQDLRKLLEEERRR